MAIKKGTTENDAKIIQDGNPEGALFVQGLTIQTEQTEAAPKEENLLERLSQTPGFEEYLAKLVDTKLAEQKQTEPSPTESEATIPQAKPERMVWIKLFKDSGPYKDDVTVGVNGKMYKIQRGVDVEVPESVAKIIEQSSAQDNAAAEMMMRFMEEYANDPDTRA